MLGLTHTYIWPEIEASTIYLLNWLKYDKYLTYMLM